MAAKKIEELIEKAINFIGKIFKWTIWFLIFIWCCSLHLLMGLLWVVWTWVYIEGKEDDKEYIDPAKSVTDEADLWGVDNFYRDQIK